MTMNFDGMNFNEIVKWLENENIDFSIDINDDYFEECAEEDNQYPVYLSSWEFELPTILFGYNGNFICFSD